MRSPARTARLARPLVLLLAAAAPAPAQQLHWSGAGSEPDSRYGYGVARAGDVDGDGLDDFLVGDPGAEPAGPYSGLLEVRSGVDGSLLHVVEGTASQQQLGRSSDGLGDLDGDGSADFVVGCRVVPVQVHSGSDGSLMASLPTPSGVNDGVVVSAAGDVNADGWPDVLLGDPSADAGGLDTAGQVIVVSGRWIATGAPPEHLFVLDGSQPGGRYGHSVDDVGDLDGDGHDDLLVGTPYHTGTQDGVDYCGVVQVISGQTGAVLRTHLSPGPTCSWWGEIVAGVGDLDGDGVGDYASSMPFGMNGTQPQGIVRVHSGATGDLFVQHVGATTGERFGWAFDGAGDVNGDGHGDLLVGSPSYDGSADNGGRAVLLSGLDGSVLHTWIGAVPYSELGHPVAGLGDVNGDGLGDLALSAAGFPPGTCSVYVGECQGQLLPYCDATGNSTGMAAQIDATGSTSHSANDLVLHASGAPPGQPGIFFYGPQIDTAPLGDGVRCVGGQIFRIFPAVQLGPSGTASLALDLTAPPANGGPGEITPGSKWYFQLWFRDPAAGGAGSNLTNGLAASFCP